MSTFHYRPYLKFSQKLKPFNSNRPNSLQPPTKQIYFRLQYKDKLMQQRKGWSQIEDDRLSKIIKKYGTKNWTLVSQKLSLGSINQRTGKQCRQRWHNHLNPTISKMQWSITDDEVLFQAHRKYGSKWKEISKLFQGRTDNSIKNHFYSTVRRCLRRISKLCGEKAATITMKSIKPFVLSKIVQNAELTNLILKLGRDKMRGCAAQPWDIDEITLNNINSQLKRINSQYSSNNKQQNGELSKKSRSSGSYHSLQFFDNQVIAQDLPPSLPRMKQKRSSCQHEALKQYLEQQSCKRDNEGQQLILQTQQQSKQRNQTPFQLPFRSFDEQTNQKQKAQTAEKQQKWLDKQQKEESFWVEEEESRNFFNSPSCGRKNRFPDVRLLGKVSRNSQSPGCQSYQGQERVANNFKQSWLKEQKLQIQFDPRQLFISNFADKQQSQI